MLALPGFHFISGIVEGAPRKRLFPNDIMEAGVEEDRVRAEKLALKVLPSPKKEITRKTLAKRANEEASR